MNIKQKLSVIALVALLGGMIVPAFADNGSGMSDRDMDHNGQGMMHGGMMSRGMMGSCSEMMQSRNNGGGPPNSRWQNPQGSAMPN